jgi:glycosyltransferase 2 family protein
MKEPTIDSENSTQNKHHLLSGWRFGALIITIVLSIVGYFLFSLWGGWRQVLDAVIKVGPKGISMALVLSLINYALRFIRWQGFLKAVGHTVPWLSSLRIYLAGFALTVTPGKAGEAFRSIFLKDYGITYRKSFGAFFAERLSDLIAVAIIAAGGLWVYPDARLIIALVGVVIIFVIYAVQKESWLHGIEQFMKNKLPPRFAHIIEFIIETVLAFRSCFRVRTLFYGIFLGIIAWSAEGLAFYYILTILDSGISVFTALFIYAFSLVIGAVTFLPGGLGGAEVTMLQLLLLNQMPASDAVAATIVIRLTTLWFSVLIGLCCIPRKRLDIT